MPTRILRDWTDSEKLADLDWRDEVLFTRLIMKADDFGRFTANPKLVRSLCFPLKDGIREADISRSLAVCHRAGLIALYQVADKPLLEILNFNQRLRATVSKYPANDGHSSVSCPTSDGDMPPESESDKEAKTEARSTSGKPPRAQLSDEDFIQQLKESPAYRGVNIDAELAKMDLWLLTPKGRGRKRTHQFILNWLNKAERIVAPEQNKQLPPAASNWRKTAENVKAVLDEHEGYPVSALREHVAKYRTEIASGGQDSRDWLQANLNPWALGVVREVWGEM